MLVEINLLPRKEKPNMAMYAILLIVAIVVLLSGIFMYSKMNDNKAEMRRMESEIQRVKLQKIEQQKKLSENTDAASLEKLKGLVASIENYPIHTVDVLNRVSRLLPRDGYVQSFGYTDETITLGATFAQHADATYYYKRLVDESWITKVSIAGISSTKEGEALAAYSSTYTITVNKEKLKDLQKEGIVDEN